MKRIDTHQHFWRLQRGDYDWLSPERSTPAMATLCRDFEPQDLTPLLQQHGIDGTVLVQAAPTDAETDFLLQLSEQHEYIKGVVGWVDFDSEQAPKRIAQLAQHPKLVGLRPMIQDIEDVNWMLRSTVGTALQSLSLHQLVFDALVKPQHLVNLKHLVDQHPDLQVVINHAAKPDIKGRYLKQWQTDISAFYDYPQVSCKLSGLVTEAKTDWQPEDLFPYMNTLCDVFGEQRILWGSDWPVCLLASSYKKWFDTVDAYLKQNNLADKAILGGNAIRIYKLKE